MKSGCQQWISIAPNKRVIRNQTALPVASKLPIWLNGLEQVCGGWVSEEKGEAESGPTGHKCESWPAWRVVLTDFVIVVLGVGVAMAAQQAVEKMHDNGRAAEARAGVRQEIARNLANMNLREATETCMSARLDEVQGLIAASAAGRLPQETLWIGHPIEPSPVDGKYKMATESGAASLFDDKEQSAYAELYGHFAEYSQRLQEEARAWADLRTLETHPPSSATLDWQLRSAMQQARMERYYITFLRQLALRQAADLSVSAGEQEKLKMPPVCAPLHTARDEAAKLTAKPGYDLPVP